MTVHLSLGVKFHGSYLTRCGVRVEVRNGRFIYAKKIVRVDLLGFAVDHNGSPAPALDLVMERPGAGQ